MEAKAVLVFRKIHLLFYEKPIKIKRFMQGKYCKWLLNRESTFFHENCKDS